MATGRGNYLTKQTGEYIVAAELSRRGFVATTFTGNVPWYDIVAVDDKGGHCVGQSYGGAILLQMALDFPDAVHSLALLEPALPSVLGNSQAFTEMVGKVVALYSSGDTPGAIATFAEEVAGADFRAVFDQTLPPGHFERWVADADTIFQSDLPALQQWQFTHEDAARITQPVLNLRGANTKPYFKEIHETVRTWLPHAEHSELADATHAMLQTNPKGAAERLVSFFSHHR